MTYSTLPHRGYPIPSHSALGKGNLRIYSIYIYRIYMNEYIHAFYIESMLYIYIYVVYYVCNVWNVMYVMNVMYVIYVMYVMYVMYAMSCV